MEMASLPELENAISTQTRKALLIGVRYFGSPSLELMCTHGDVMNIRKALISHYHYRPEDITVMLDTNANEGTDLWPSSDNILEQMSLLLSAVREGDRRCFMFAGHGWQTLDGEVGGIQAIVPVDGLDEYDSYVHEHLIAAHEMGALMIAPLPEHGCAFTAIIDCCNSSEILGLGPASLDSSSELESQDESGWDTSDESSDELYVEATFASRNISEVHSLAEDLLRASTSSAPVEIIDIVIDSAESQDIEDSQPSGLGLTLQPGENDHTPTKLGEDSSTTLVVSSDVSLPVTPPRPTHWPEDAVMTDSEDSDFLRVTDAELAALSASTSNMDIDDDLFATPTASKARLEPSQGISVAKPSAIICWSSRTSMVFESDKGVLSKALGEALENPDVITYRDMYRDVRKRVAASCQKLKVKQSVQLARLRAFDYDQEMVL